MIFCRLSVVFVLAVLSTLADTRSQESLVMRVFNSDFHPSDDQIVAALKKADLESHGFKKEVITSLKSDPGSNKPVWEKRYLYDKTVSCSRAQEVVQELQTLCPAAYGMDVVTKINSEIKARNLTNMKQCNVGVELHFKEGRNCPDKNNGPVVVNEVRALFASPDVVRFKHRKPAFAT